VGRHLHGKAVKVDPKTQRDYMIAIGRRIRDLRLEEGISVRELAAAIGAVPSQIHKLENAAHPSGKWLGPHVWLICRIAIALRRSPSELMPS
jgi:transcriptional regulator with XRE-family HTH domain